MNYKVVVSSQTVIDEHNNAIPNALIHDIRWPHIDIDTDNGPASVISGQPTSTISIKGRKYYDVPCVL